MADNEKSKIKLPPPLPPSKRVYNNDTYQQTVVRDVSAYAKDLVRPDNSHKHKFLFIAEIDFAPQYLNIVDKSRFALLVQTATRPKVKFEHAEINAYGVRKGVLTKTTYDPVNLSFIDDNHNSSMQFFTNVVRLMSPITNITNSDTIDTAQYNFNGAGQGTLLTTKSSKSDPGTINTQETTNGQNSPNVYAQSSGYPASNEGFSAPKSLFATIKIHHVHGFGAAVNTFTYHNPRLLTIDFDDLDMAAGNELALLKMSFGYDYFTVETAEMTKEISHLVGRATEVNYTLRRDLDRQ